MCVGENQTERGCVKFRGQLIGACEVCVSVCVCVSCLSVSRLCHWCVFSDVRLHEALHLSKQPSYYACVMPHTACTDCIRAVFDAPCVSTYLFLIYRRGRKFSLAKIIRIYDCLCAVSDRGFALQRHTAGLIVFGHYCLVPPNQVIVQLVIHHGAHVHTQLKKNKTFLLLFFLNTVFEHLFLQMCAIRCCFKFVCHSGSQYMQTHCHLCLSELQFLFVGHIECLSVQMQMDTDHHHH